jgi:hypothetical protein
MRRSLRQRAAAWTSLAVLLAGSLLPALVQAMARAGGEGWVEVCTAQGPRLRAPVAGDARSDERSDGEALASLQPHCPGCLAGLNAAPPPAAPWAHGPWAELADAPRGLGTRAPPATATTQPLPPPRGPPGGLAG